MAPQGSAAGFDAIQTALGYFQAGQLAQAEAVCQQALSVSPRHPDVLHLAGMIAGQAGKREMAVELINKAIGIKPSGAMYYNLGSVLHDMGRLDEAIENYRKAIELAPHFVEAYCNLGLALTDQGRLDEAIEICRQALALRPDFVEAYNNMGNALRYQGKLEMAIACYRKALVLKPDLPEVCNNLGCALQEIGEVDEAIKSFHKALALRPNDAEAHIGLGWTHHDMGQFDTAKAHFDRAIALKPDHPVAWAALPSVQKMTVADSAWAEKAQRLLSGGVKLQEEMRLCYALGKYNNDVGRYGDAFLFYERANRLKRQLAGPFDRETFRRFIDAIIAAYPSGVVRQQRDGGSDSCRPLFIVGMPRSGTSLTEQILASHPDAFGAGELRFWAQQANGCLLAMPSRRYDPTLLQDIAKQYEDELQRHSSNALRVVDKMPDNFLYLGLIHAVFPRARILHTRRNPVDTCLSIYFQNFSSRHAYASDLDDLAFYYREYHRLMAHWREVLPPEVLLDVPYEALIEDQEGWSRRIIEFVGLEWDERCLNFHETERKVGTASNWQVRQKIYKTSKERWRNYEKFVGSLLPLLELTA